MGTNLPLFIARFSRWHKIVFDLKMTFFFLRKRRLPTILDRVHKRRSSQNEYHFALFHDTHLEPITKHVWPQKGRFLWKWRPVTILDRERKTGIRSKGVPICVLFWDAPKTIKHVLTSKMTFSKKTETTTTLTRVCKIKKTNQNEYQFAPSCGTHLKEKRFTVYYSVFSAQG